MSLLKRNSPRRTRAKKETDLKNRVGETPSPTLGPVVEKVQPVDTEMVNELIEEYKYKPEPEIEPVQLNRALEEVAITEPVAPVAVIKARLTFNLYDLSFFCEERIYNLLWLPQNIKIEQTRILAIQNIQDRLNVYSEYSKEVTVGSFRDNIHFYSGEVLVPEEFINITGFIRKFLNINQVHVLYETGEILLQDCEYCNFWMERAPAFFKPVNVPLDSPKLLDDDVCLDCNLKCIIRHSQQMIN